jgi:hypothetical protein
MKASCSLLALCAVFVAPLRAGAAPDPVMVPIEHFSVGFNTNNVPLAMTAFVKTGIVILDEFAPHEWSGPNAVALWLKGLEVHDTKNGVTDGIVDLGKPLVETSDGIAGYVVAPAVYRYKQHGKPMREPATMTFALKNVGGAWLISARIRQMRLRNRCFRQAICYN